MNFLWKISERSWMSSSSSSASFHEHHIITYSTVCLPVSFKRREQATNTNRSFFTFHCRHISQKMYLPALPSALEKMQSQSWWWWWLWNEHKFIFDWSKSDHWSVSHSPTWILNFVQSEELTYLHQNLSLLPNHLTFYQVSRSNIMWCWHGMNELMRLVK